MPSRTRPGSVVAWWDGSALSFAVVAGETRQRVQLILRDGGEQRVQPSRVAFEIEPAAQPPPGPSLEERRAAGRRAAAAEDRVRALAGDVEVALLWELTKDAGSPLEGNTLAELALGRSSGEARAAVLLALQEDGAHFFRKADLWEPRSPEAVEEIHRERRRVAERAADKDAVLTALAAAGRGEPFLPTGSEVERRYLGALEELAVEDRHAVERSKGLAIEALEASGVRGDSPSERAFRLLRHLGRFTTDDENLQIRRYGLRTEFPPEILDAARRAAARGFERANRRDLTALEVFTVDSPHTREIDDGISLEAREDGGDGSWRLGVHIADPAAFIEVGDPLDVEAYARAASHYFPDARLPMLPGAISEEAASLLEGQERPALSLLAEIDALGQVVQWELVRSIVRSRRRLSYEDADEAIERGVGPLADLLRIASSVAELLERRRIEAGAIRILATEVEPRVEAGGRVVLERWDPNSRSHGLVSEAMVLLGSIAARFGVEQRVPILYRRQPVPAQLPAIPSPGGLEDPVAVRALRRALRRGEVGVEPRPHFALGLPAYAQATSPLRRYQDLVTQRQILSSLEGRPAVYDLETVRRIAATTERAEADARQAERVSERYWLLRYLEQEGAETVEGIVVETHPPVVQLDETLIEEKVPGLVGAEPGQRVRLRIERINPRADLLVLRVV